ncbi:MAG: response regulator [Candidatus Colwellbacteria bacterium]|nr:response regulator [Candidatus Colwellbacteria bacterium]
MREKSLILVVDDEADMLDIAKARLTAGGYEVATAIDAEMAYKKAKELKPDLMLLDIRMPGINGTEALLDFKNNADIKDTPIAFFTNLTVPWPGVGVENEKFAKELGAVTIIDKSKDMDQLADVVKKILNDVSKNNLKRDIEKEVDKLGSDEKN